MLEFELGTMYMGFWNSLLLRYSEGYKYKIDGLTREIEYVNIKPVQVGVSGFKLRVQISYDHRTPIHDSLSQLHTCLGHDIDRLGDNILEH